MPKLAKRAIRYVRTLGLNSHMFFQFLPSDQGQNLFSLFAFISRLIYCILPATGCWSSTVQVFLYACTPESVLKYARIVHNTYTQFVYACDLTQAFHNLQTESDSSMKCISQVRIKILHIMFFKIIPIVGYTQQPCFFVFSQQLFPISSPCVGSNPTAGQSLILN